ncbi:MAG: hypothetical protein H6Q52_1106 [Deltaproteobacteria bacterium]|nr:hypothetical protein [Deltaproteobacteria bacterium]
MKGYRYFQKTLLIGLSLLSFAFSFVFDAASAGPGDNFERYRQTIKNEYGIDIKDFKDSMKGGRADGKPITKYDLNQILMGIKVEQEHASDKMRALEIVTDHLEEFGNYYTLLLKMEEEAEDQEKESAEKKKK